MGVLHRDPFGVQHWTTEVGGSQPLLGPPADGGQSMAILHRPFPRLAWFHPGILSLPTILNMVVDSLMWPWVKLIVG